MEWAASVAAGKPLGPSLKRVFSGARHGNNQNPIQISWKRETAADEAAPEDERPDAPAAPHMYMDAHGANVGNGRASSIFNAMVE